MFNVFISFTLTTLQKVRMRSELFKEERVGLLKGPLSFSRFMVIGEWPSDFTEMIDRQLRQYAFQDLAGSTDEKTMGWTGIENILDTDFSHASYVWGDYLLFSMRIDRRAVPPSLLKIRVMEAEKHYLKETGRKKIDRIAREELREGVRRDLMSHIHPTPSFFDICWCVSGGTVLLTSLSEKVMQDFQDFFKTSFEWVPCPFVPWDPHVLIQKDADKINLLDSDGSSGIDQKSPGREFLTWLWFKSEERDGIIMIPDSGETEIHLMRRLVLESGDGEYSESVVCQGMHADLKEGREALRQGKKIREARIQLTRDAATWEFTFKADRFQFQSLKMPVVMEPDEEGDNPDGHVLERIYLLETVIRTMDQLFTMFLSLRRSGEWQQEQTRMERWLQTTLKRDAP